MAGGENNTRDILLHDANNIGVSKNQTKVKEYFESLNKKEQEVLIKRFEAEKING